MSDNKRIFFILFFLLGNNLNAKLPDPSYVLITPPFTSSSLPNFTGIPRQLQLYFDSGRIPKGSLLSI
jgi:hypothetical protein